MLLRRVIEHVKTQNWTAVALDFAIVVVGVFIGIQVSNWNEDRAFRNQERVYLAELRTEIQEGIILSQSWRTYLQEVSAAGERSIRFINSGDACQSDCWDRIIDFFHASQYISVELESTVFDEMQRLGLPRERSVEEAITGLYSQNAGIAGNLNERPDYRKVVRELIPYEMLDLLWDGCHHVTQGVESLSRDCLPTHDPEILRATVDQIRSHPRIKPSLNHWTSMTRTMGPYIEDQNAAGLLAIAAIDEELGDK